MATDHVPPRRHLQLLWPAPRPRPRPERPAPVVAPLLPGSAPPPPVVAPPALQTPSRRPPPVLSHVDDPSLWTIEATRSVSASRSRVLQWLLAAAVSFMVAGAVIMVGFLV